MNYGQFGGQRHPGAGFMVTLYKAIFQPAGEPENNSSPGAVGMGRKGVRYANCKRGDFN